MSDEPQTAVEEERYTTTQWLVRVYSDIEDMYAKTHANRYMKQSELLALLDIHADDILLMHQIASRLQWIASGLVAAKEPKFKIVNPTYKENVSI